MKRWIISFSFVFLFLTAAVLNAQVICPLNGKPLAPKGLKSLESFKRLPVLDAGRIKPVDTYARNILLQLSGRQSFERKPASVWFARLVFAPQTTKKDKVFLINNPSIPAELGLAVDKHRRYSFEQLEPKIDIIAGLAQAASRIPEKERDVVDSEMIRVFENLRVYSDLSHAFEFAFPSDDFSIKSERVLKQLGFPSKDAQLSFLDIAFAADSLRPVLDSVQIKKPSQWTEDEAQVVTALKNLYQWSMQYKDMPFAIVPSAHSPLVWLSPWDTIAQGFSNEGSRLEVNYLRNMLVAYWNGEQIQFDVNARLYLSSIKPRVSLHPDREMGKIDLELSYNRADLFLYSKMFYFLAFGFFLCGLSSSRSIWQKLGFACVVAGFMPHVLALIMRIMILGRPPVTNLYETFIFVGFVVALLGITIEFFNRNWLGIVTASVGGLALLMIAAKYSAEGDTLKMLVAVLNSNFWLSTHVISITIGYGSTCVAGILGHIYLLQVIFKKNSAAVLDSTHKILIGMLGLALTLTFLGTNLGGIWADQSWGRFWGWDPKENGALMIVIWTALLFHARIAKLIGPVGLAAGAVFGMIVVMWAWFGVNLLSIGLHSYGFTSGIATALGIYLACEILFLVVTLSLIKGRK